MDAKMFLRKAGIALVFGWCSLLIGGCSLANREGPDATCGSLGNGSANACRDGIIATCQRSVMSYQACDSKDACSATWQQAGLYRCDESDSLPILAASAGGSSNSGGGGSTGPGGGSARGGASGTGCDPSGPCSIASTGGQDIDWYAVDAQNAYFSDCKTVWSVPTAGGFPTVLATGLKDCSFGNIEVDATDLYFTENSSPSESVVRVPKAGGSPVRLVATTSGQLGALATDNLNIYWLDGFDIKTLPKLGGTEQTVASISISTKRLQVRGGFIYWGQSDSIGRVSTSGPFPASSAALPIGNLPADFAVTDTSVFFAVEASGIIGNLPLGGGAWTQLASSQPSPSVVMVDGSYVYWVSVPQSAEIRKANVTGGSPALVAKATFSFQNVGRVVTDSSHVYWSEGPGLMRAPK